MSAVHRNSPESRLQRCSSSFRPPEDDASQRHTHHDVHLPPTTTQTVLEPQEEGREVPLLACIVGVRFARLYTAINPAVVTRPVQTLAQLTQLLKLDLSTNLNPDRPEKISKYGWHSTGKNTRSMPSSNVRNPPACSYDMVKGCEKKYQRVPPLSAHLDKLSRASASSFHAASALQHKQSYKGTFGYAPLS